MGLRPPTKPTLPRYRSPSVGKAGVAEVNLDSEEDKDKAQQSVREVERSRRNRDQQIGTSGGAPREAEPLAKEGSSAAADFAADEYPGQPAVKSQKITLIDKVSGRPQQSSPPAVKSSEKAGETEPSDAILLDRDAKDTATATATATSKERNTRKRRAELPSRKVRSLSRRRAPGEGDSATAAAQSRGADAAKARSEERRPFSYLRKNGGKQSYSSAKIGDEYKQPTRLLPPPPRAKVISAGQGRTSLLGRGAGATDATVTAPLGRVVWMTLDSFQT
ncbi:hypothetical protein BIW11_08388 [Tropilaelaps mercedesae]|uniref:Uncharacterized protein n=1 Tax=Tropilaelaps mercedesae TaxID=418985 RepID=A0A1V9XPS1_9ACAR|nr:hypothetical protein BIW11_08388 [Tropilaelaps mercedesae]